LTSSIKMRPSCTGSIVLAISTSLRAATSGSVKGFGSTYFVHGFILFVSAAHDDFQRVIRQSSLKCPRLVPWRAQPDVALLVGH